MKRTNHYEWTGSAGALTDRWSRRIGLVTSLAEPAPRQARPQLNADVRQEGMMSKLSGREIRLFVAGALAVLGAWALIRIPFYYVDSLPMAGFHTVLSAFAGLALPLGIAILFGNQSAVVVTRIYLWIMVVAGCIAVPASYSIYHDRVEGTVLRRAAIRNTPEVLLLAVLLALVTWSYSRRLAHDTDA